MQLLRRQWVSLLLVGLLPLNSQGAKNSLQKGCLYNKLSSHKQLRVCNSEDYLESDVDPVESGACRAPEFDYLEVRIKCQDWESVIFGSWVLQILLSEVLGVPTTLETGRPDAVMQYYDEEARFQFGTTSNNLQAFRNAVELGNGDCRNIVQNSTDPEDYLNCAHVIPEVWTARSKQVQEYIREDILDPPLALGALGVEGWYIPKFTAEADPTLTSWIGLQGEENRHKLAKTFKRPTSWKDYCEEVSPTNCTVPDPIAQRAPEDDREGSRLHSSGLYTGFFRPTERGDCNAHPDTCTGHIGDFPCGWGGALEATCHWLNISLESNGNEPNSGGYTYGQLGQMWRAANETRNHIAMMWVVPDPVYEEFLGTDFEFVKVTLPPPTQKCQQFKINPEHRCNDDPALRLGTAEGVCDESARPLHKLMLRQLFDLTQAPSIPEAIRNPAHPVVSQFSLSELQINDMFRYWLLQPDEPREAICQWVVDNLDDLEQLLPRSYPRTIQDKSQDPSSTARWLFIASAIVGTNAFLLVVITTALVYRHRNRRVLRCAQVEFLYLLLLGSAMVSIGAILTGLQTPQNASCIGQIWLVSLGYTMQLVPLLVKVSAINSLMQAAQRMRRVQLQRWSLYGGVALIGVLVAIYLVLWSVLDPPQKQAHYELTDQVLVNGDDDRQSASLFDTTVVSVQYFCSSHSVFWQYVAIAWNLILILWATALAFQSRAVKQHFNEAQVLSRLIYAHFLFVLLRVMAQFFEPAVSVPVLSFVYSLDTICMILVYFVPKFFANDQDALRGTTSTYVSGLGAGSMAGSMAYASSYSCRNESTRASNPFDRSSSLVLSNKSQTGPSDSIVEPLKSCPPPDSDEFGSSHHSTLTKETHKKQVSFVTESGDQRKGNVQKESHIGIGNLEDVGSPSPMEGEKQECNPINNLNGTGVAAPVGCNFSPRNGNEASGHALVSSCKGANESNSYNKMGTPDLCSALNDGGDSSSPVLNKVIEDKGQHSRKQATPPNEDNILNFSNSSPCGSGSSSGDGFEDESNLPDFSTSSPCGGGGNSGDGVKDKIDSASPVANNVIKGNDPNIGEQAPRANGVDLLSLLHASPCGSGVSSGVSVEHEVDSSGPVLDNRIEDNGPSSKDQAPFLNEANLRNFSNSNSGNVNVFTGKTNFPSTSPCDSGVSSEGVFENETNLVKLKPLLQWSKQQG